MSPYPHPKAITYADKQVLIFFAKLDDPEKLHVWKVTSIPTGGAKPEQGDHADLEAAKLEDLKEKSREETLLLVGRKSLASLTILSFFPSCKLADGGTTPSGSRCFGFVI